MVSPATPNSTSERDWFYRLINIESFPEFLPSAKLLAQEYLQAAGSALANPGSLPASTLSHFKYSHEALDERMNAIYADLVEERDQVLEPTNPKSQQYFSFWTHDRIRQRLLQFAPFNLTDGAWLQNVSRAGIINKAQAMLFSIWADEFGNGRDSENHSNVYRDLLNSIGIYLPDTRTKSFVEDHRFLDSAFSAPVFQLAMSQFSTTFLPELIGMTLWIEWTAPPQMQIVAQLLKFLNYNAQFYSLHVGIDNPVNGHGAHAKEIVRLYLDEVRQNGGDESVQDHWRRIWTGYVAFHITGTLGADLDRILTTPKSIHERMVELIARNAPYARQMHLDKVLVDSKTKTSRLLNDFFADPEGLLTALVDNNLVVPGKPEDSRFLHLLQFEGPMYKVFSTEDIELIKAWIHSLQVKTQPVPVSKTPGDAMADLVDKLRKPALGVIAHNAMKVSGPDPKAKTTVTEQTVAWWLDPLNASTSEFMGALANDVRYIVSGKPDESVLITKYLAPSRQMAQRFGPKDVQTVKDWIASGCPQPEQGEETTFFAVFMDTELPE